MYFAFTADMYEIACYNKPRYKGAECVMSILPGDGPPPNGARPSVGIMATKLGVQYDVLGYF